MEDNLIKLKTLSLDERAVYGICPVCHAPQGASCLPGWVHAARLINAPSILAVEDDE